jgi:PPOX class probable F420-dependent enzyme
MSELVWDETDPVHAKALAALQRELVGWISTVDRAGAPRSVPVWFFWDDGVVAIITRPDTAKAKHLRAGSAAQFHLNAGGPFGDDVVILSGEAELQEGATAAWMAPRRETYEAKYREAIADYGMPLDDIIDSFSALILLRPTKLLAW